MENYRVITQQNPQSTAVPVFSQPGFFFHQHPHLHHQDNGQFRLISAINQDTGQADAHCAFFVQSNRAVSPLAAPFGSIEFTETLPDSVLDSLITSVLAETQRAETSTLRLVNYPTCYAPRQTERLTQKLHMHGFTITEDYPTFFLSPTEQSITDHTFEFGLAPAERRRLRKCRQANFRVVHQRQPTVAETILFIQETRCNKGYPLTIATEKLASLLNEFPNQYAVFTVMDGPTIAALTVTVRVRHDILYNFLPASNPDYAAFSPMVLLVDGLFQYCQQQRIRLLDLGLSLDHHRQPKPSLMRFKRNLGAQESPKLVFDIAL